MTRADDAAAEGLADGRRNPSLALGLVTTVPLLLAYEASLVAAGVTGRNTARELLFLPLEPLGAWLDTVRVLLLFGVGAVAWLVLAHHEERPVRAILRVLLEGLVAAVCLGPALVRAHLWLAGLPPVDVPNGPPAAVPDLATIGLLAGAGGCEEFVFRFLAYSLCFLVARHIASFFGLPVLGARIAGDVFGVLGSAALFAAFHLAAFTEWLGPGGEPFDARLFAWRFLAGLLLGLLFRWRGLGVAAWAHALFNAAMALGVGPGVFLPPAAS
jgi:hypothetical protein